MQYNTIFMFFLYCNYSVCPTFPFYGIRLDYSIYCNAIPQFGLNFHYQNLLNPNFLNYNANIIQMQICQSTYTI